MMINPALVATRTVVGVMTVGAATTTVVATTDPPTAMNARYSQSFEDRCIRFDFARNSTGATTRQRTQCSRKTIVTGDLAAARRFVAEVDSSAVIVNASTRFNDGGQLGLGAEIGISTDKFHARGPCGLDELTSYKYVVYGSGQVREG